MNIISQNETQVKRPIRVVRQNGDVFSLNIDSPESMRPVEGSVFWRMEHGGGWVTEIMRDGTTRYYRQAQDG